ncbi:hypothetical protein EXU48_09880 [Occultella glacieicola]|uniref:Uncharacterized protein n=1 Tax=Occultella glacieicola TaxID=2518684 RepID=A0ABY2E6B3_9MICO|nr:hypothetical protein [Occultella glacieicola]TDE95065.1 hypothetical protein EXU48_09880 [Occultella glacieicola]
MAEVSITVCDMCGQLGRSTARYGITQRRRTVQFDLCEQHAAPLERVLDSKRPDDGSWRRFEGMLRTFEEIEEQKHRRADES